MTPVLSSYRSSARSLLLRLPFHSTIAMSALLSYEGEAIEDLPPEDLIAPSTLAADLVEIGLSHQSQPPHPLTLES